MRKQLLVLTIIACSMTVKGQKHIPLIVEKLLATDTTSLGQNIVYPKFNQAEVTVQKITFPPGASTGWHKHEFPVFSYIILGELTVETEDHKILRFKENTSFSESINTFHNGTNKGKTDLVVVAMYIGGKGEKLAIHKQGEEH
jgi:quercetin dioxygenase-like cupin family protein